MKKSENPPAKVFGLKPAQEPRALSAGVRIDVEKKVSRTDRRIPAVIGAIFAFSLVLCSASFAEEPAGIILKNSPAVASDLLGSNGDVLPTDQALAMKRQGADLSTLNPGESDLWSPKGGKVLEASRFEFDSNTPVSFGDVEDSDFGEFCFSGYVSGNSQTRFDFLVGRKAHNLLLRAALLKKMGYTVPQLSWKQNVQVRFDSPFSKEDFIDQLKENTGTPSDYQKRWVVSEDDTSVTLQDVVVMKSGLDFYNLALGFFPSSMIQGRRELNALTVPYALTEVPESINLLYWNCGTAVGDKIVLQHHSADQFYPSYDDARWSVRLLSRLSEEDFREIVQETSLPPEAGDLLLQKLLARRNSLVNLFGIDAMSLPVDFTVSGGDHLRNGKLLPQTDESGHSTDYWPGYGSRFVFGDFEDPFSFSEVSAYVKSIGLSTILEKLVAKFNQSLLPNTDVPGEIAQRQQNIFIKALKDYLTSGKPMELSMGTIKVPYINTNLIASRDLIIGQYLGTNNNLQLAESIGLSVGGGLSIASDILPKPLSLSAQVGSNLTRTYTHIEPVLSMKAALKQPFKNFIVPLFRAQLAEKLEKAEDTSPPNQLLESFNDSIGVGDSLVITDSVALDGGAHVGMGINRFASVGSSVFGNQLVISRTHIFRVDKDKIQVYKETGDLGTVGFGVSIDAGIPVLSANFPFGKGHASTKLFTLDFGNDVPADQLRKNTRALARLLRSNSTDYLTAVDPPFQFTHSFNYQEADLGLFFLKWKHRSELHRIQVSDPAGHQKEYVDRIKESLNGQDYQNLTLNGVNAALSLSKSAAISDLSLSLPDQPDPADTIRGRSSVRKIEFQGELNNQFVLQNADSSDFVVDVSRRWRGFGASRSKVLSILNEIQKEAGNQLYPPDPLNNTQELRFYDVNLRAQLSSEAVMRLLSASKITIAGWLAQKYIQMGAARYDANTHQYVMIGPDELQEGDRQELIGEIDTVSNALPLYRQALSSGDAGKAAEIITGAIGVLEDSLRMKGIYEILQGQGIVISSSIDGIRYGDEDGNENSIHSQVIGQMDGKYLSGPLEHLLEVTGISQPELMLTWLMSEF